SGPVAPSILGLLLASPTRRSQSTLTRMLYTLKAHLTVLLCSPVPQRRLPFGLWIVSKSMWTTSCVASV
ncbi:unnamed protein product, partial [Aphanomyces euteiches]